MTNAASWFEIPTLDFQRAIDFYNAAFGFELVGADVEPIKIAAFPAESGVGGALVYHPNYIPSFNGTTVYLTVKADIADILVKIEELGGTVVVPKMPFPVSPGGFLAQFTDSEGNRVGLMSSR
jgi:uncharacterized protein